MRHLDCFRPVTRRALPINYVSPLICELSISSGSGSSSGDSATIDITPVTRRDGPASLSAIVVGGVEVHLTWNAPSYVFSYVVYRATNPDGPFVQLTSNLDATLYIDTPGAGTWYYKVTGLEPDFGETYPSPIASATI